MRATQFLPGMSFAETMTNSSHGIAGSNVIFLIFPRGMLLRTVAPYNIPGMEMSSMYCARPVTLSRPSLRGTDIPTICSVFTRFCFAEPNDSDERLRQPLPPHNLSGKLPVLKHQGSAQVGSLHCTAQLLA